MSNLNHIAAKPSVKKESSLQLGVCVAKLLGGWGKADPLQSLHFLAGSRLQKHAFLDS